VVKAVSDSETSVNICQTTQYHISEDTQYHTCCYENFNFHQNYDKFVSKPKHTINSCRGNGGKGTHVTNHDIRCGRLQAVPALTSGERASDIVGFQVLIAMSMKSAVEVKKK
jgi:hypothetical protein